MSMRPLKLNSKIIEWPLGDGATPLFQGVIYNQEIEKELETLIASLQGEDITPEEFIEQHLFLVMSQTGESHEEAKENLSSLLRRIANQLRKRL